jgi:hypothetical protein
MNQAYPTHPHSPADSPDHGDAAASAASRAERLMAEYLRVWGLRDPSTIAALARRWVDRAVLAQAHRPAEGSLGELYRLALRHAIEDIDRWLDQLTRELVARSPDISWRRGMVAMALQNVIDQHPTALLSQGPFPAVLIEQLAGCARSAVPAVCPTRMPTQSLEAINPSRTVSRWRQTWADFFGRAQLLFAPRAVWPRLERNKRW